MGGCLFEENMEDMSAKLDHLPETLGLESIMAPQLNCDT